MAKTTAPLFSFSASGAIGKALVYFPWKGIPVVRRYVVPANPEAPLQVAQRDRLELAVTEWHLGKYTAADKTAWNRYAVTLAKPMSGFNAFVKSFVDLLISGVPVVDPPYNAACITGGAGLVDVGIDEDGEATTCYCRWGYSPTAMNTQVVMVEAPANTWVATGIAATVGAKFYCRVYTNTGATPLGWSGIFTMTVV